jgi:hypothetical protein
MVFVVYEIVSFYSFESSDYDLQGLRHIQKWLGGTTYLHIFRVQVSRFKIRMSYTGIVAWMS